MDKNPLRNATHQNSISNCKNIFIFSFLSSTNFFVGWRKWNISLLYLEEEKSMRIIVNFYEVCIKITLILCGSLMLVKNSFINVSAFRRNHSDNVYIQHHVYYFWGLQKLDQNREHSWVQSARGEFENQIIFKYICKKINIFHIIFLCRFEFQVWL